MKIGDVNLKGKLFLAPMVDVTDAAYRLICRKQGAAIGYTEMLHADAIINAYRDENFKKKLFVIEKERPVGIQITSNTVEKIEKVSKIGVLESFDLVDINCGCPSHLTIDHGSGSYLLNHPEKIGKMISILKDRGFVTTAKIRLGFKENNVLKVSKIVEKAGADALTVHGRLATQGRSIPADWKELEKLSKEVSIPFIGNGDIRNGKDAEKYLKFCDGVMIARAAIGDPMIFNRINKYLKTGKESDFDYGNNLKLFLYYLKLVEKNDLVDFGRAKYLGGNFIKGFKGASQKRNEFMGLKSIGEMKEFVGEIV